MLHITAIQSSVPTTTSRNGNGLFCSEFDGRNGIADKGSGGKDIIDW